MSSRQQEGCIGRLRWIGGQYGRLIPSVESEMVEQLDATLRAVKEGPL